MRVLPVLILFWICDAAVAQEYIEPLKVEVSATKTTTLIFPSAIVSIDRGSENIIVQKSTGNILRVKAIAPFSEETNLTVVSSGGKLYSFLVGYCAAPLHLTINLSSPASVLIDTTLAGDCKRVLNQPGFLHGLQYEKGDVFVSVLGFYATANHIFCKLKIENRSPIRYGIEQVRFYVRDLKTVKRTSAQETVVTPIYVLGDSSSVQPASAQILVVALPLFTVPDQQYLALEITETSGGRNLLIRCRNRHILKAKHIY